MADKEDTIVGAISFDDDPRHPDDRQPVTVHLADLMWDEDPAPGEPEMWGCWVVAWIDGFEQRIERPRADVEQAQEEARRLIAKRLAVGFTE